MRFWRRGLSRSDDPRNRDTSEDEEARQRRIDQAVEVAVRQAQEDERQLQEAEHVTAAMLWGREFDFLARDEDGHLAVLSTAGEGPIPQQVLVRWKAEEYATNVIDHLPVSSTIAERRTRAPVVTFYESMTTRGFYCFDWEEWKRGAYCRVMVPKQPSTIESLAQVGFEVTEVLDLPLRFEHVNEIDLAQLGIALAE